jgi:hypothetical protein
MSLDELERRRKSVPVYIFAACALPWIWITAQNAGQFKFYHDILFPVIAVSVGFFYDGLNFRGVLWDDEMEIYIRPQIRKAILDLVPADLAITETEKRRLSEKEIYKKLTGVFWETVDENPQLKDQKQHFYSNGIGYSTSCDVSIICYVFAIFFYGGAVLATRRIEFWYAAALLLAVAILSAELVTPRYRARHLNLSKEQLELIRRAHSASVAKKFRAIILEWRVQSGSRRGG